ncbi:MAG: helix-turn-helix domain-containing protein [Phycisphaerales bacterium]|jgi:excisionase family DNA binding protein|nr:helix-turn-helix domain-containing protein [Phycisphaerales bacterium]
MAKLFYTLTEACERLGKTEDEVREMAKSGQLEEMRDGEQVMFKRQQIDLLAGEPEQQGDFDLDMDLSGSGSAMNIGLSDSSTTPGTEPTEDIPTPGASSGYGMSDSGTGLGIGGSASGLDLGGSGFGFDLGDSGSGSGLDLSDSSEGSGIHASFEGGEDDDNAETRVADAVDEELSLESVGSGSGLLDLTRESDDTSLGAELLDEVWEGGDSGEFGANASGLFESADPDQSTGTRAVEEDSPIGLPVAAIAQEYDGKWSGTSIGLLLGAMVAMIAISVMLVTNIMGVAPKLATMVTGNLMVWVGGIAAFAIIAALVGMFIGKASE